MLCVFKVTQSLEVPLIYHTRIYTNCSGWVRKILRVGNELILGGSKGYLEVLDLKSERITNHKAFYDAEKINDIVAIDETTYLLATR